MTDSDFFQLYSSQSEIENFLHDIEDSEFVEQSPWGDDHDIDEDDCDSVENETLEHGK